MIWNNHSNLSGSHAFLSPSQYSWVNYDEDKLEDRINTAKAVRRGTELHEFAAMAIKNGIKQRDISETLNMYINDGIKYKLDPEVTLFYSKWIYGTADTIGFHKEPRISRTVPVLRIHDLKTGNGKAKLTQLYIYAALFCLEYDFRPSDICIVTRIYQFNKIDEDFPTSEIIVPIMDKIQRFSTIIDQRNLPQGDYSSWTNIV